jgi:hypothetical protein
MSMGANPLLDGRQGTGVVRRHVIACDAGMSIALCLAELRSRWAPSSIQASMSTRPIKAV